MSYRSKRIPCRNWNLPGIVFSWLKFSTLNRLDLWLHDIPKPRHLPISDHLCLAKVLFVRALEFSAFWESKLLFGRGSNELLEMYYHTTYSFSWNFWIVELNQNNAFNSAAAYLTKTKGMLKSIKSCKVIFMHRMALLNDLMRHSWSTWIAMGGMMDWGKKRCIHNETWGRQIISQKASYVVILILKKGNNFKSPLFTF